MKYSLLYRNGTPETEESFDITYDLAVDRLVRLTVADARRADYFLAILMKPLTSVEDIVYRQEQIVDYLTIPGLYEELRTVFNRYDKVKSDWREMRSVAYPGSTGANSRALVEYTFASLKVTALFPKTIISYFSAIADIINRYPVKSSALRGIGSYCSEMLENESLNELSNIADLFRYKAAENYEFSVTACLDDTLRMISCDLTGLEDVTARPKENVLFKFVGELIGKKRVSDDIILEQDDATVDNTLAMLNEALRRIDSALTAVTGDVYEIFCGISSELAFFDAALALIERLDEAGIKRCFPEMLPPEADLYEAEGLANPMLLCEGLDGSTIRTNSFSSSAPAAGALIHGDNNTGKTTYLRSIGTAQLMAQAGLPVCASSARISIRRGIYSHFSSAEEEFRAGDTAGRFEGEVQCVAKIIDGLESHPYSLVLLNETFQTTAYSEGAQGMLAMLETMPAAKARFVFVTRMTRLVELVTPNPTLFPVSHMTAGFKAERV